MIRKGFWRMRYFLRLSYKGTKYHGWQVQQNAHSVQAELESSLSKIYNTEVEVTGCGRTDAGVHARVFYAHFDAENVLNLIETQLLMTGLNKILPSDISINGVIPVKEDAHARFSAISRTYKYFILREKDPFRRETAYFYGGKLDLEKMNELAGILYDYSDFTSFSKLHTQVKSNICKIEQAFWQEADDQLIFTITADRFLRNMVRAIVGTMMDAGRGKLTGDDFRKIIESRDRSLAGFSVPSHGLFLEDVVYPEEIFV